MHSETDPIGADEQTLLTPLQFLPGMGPVRAQRFGRLGLRNAQDVIFLFPRDYEYPAPTATVDSLEEGEPAALVGKVVDAEFVSRRPGRSMFAALIQNESGVVRTLFFNQPFRADQLEIDQAVLISGTPKMNGMRMEFVHPKVTLLDDAEDVPEPRILPVYPLSDGIKQSEVRRVVAETTERLADQLVEVMPDSLRHAAANELRQCGVELEGDLVKIETALKSLHQPESRDHLLAARMRLVFQELLVMQLALAMRRRKLTTDLHSPPLAASAMIDARIVNRFPFELTGDQKTVIGEISRDMARQFPMNRLLQGDVGSGKTVVAVYAMMLAVANGHQAALMAPTEVLARQHFQTLTEILADSRVSVGLLCGSLTTSERRSVIESTAAGSIDLLVGTQALIYGGIDFKSLGLCVIDEQHKFGVAQRVALRSGGIDPHYLVMSATPIPRSVAMTLFGDVELSTLREKPPGRGKISTYLAHDGWKDRWWTFVRERLDEGRQVFVVAPRVSIPTNEGEAGEDVASVEAVFEDLCNGALADYRLGLLHGRMHPEEKQSIMEAFAAGKIQVLVSTTVIEVGINVPNATVMTILGAQRFGLAQLHQLRGRVARGGHEGHVGVFTDGDTSPEDNERLQVFEQTDDGFELAEADFRLRGPGDMLGRQQSGLPPMRIADLIRDQDVLIAARAMAQSLIDADPDLSGDGMSELRSQVLRRYGKRLNLGDVA
ncbi:ATP-dependent DNA helicase RecG [Rubripirellula sp.]|jgi:ATP-dependent DNA helicase RecG|nr:ATP-dependent DNA helicase RecG [Rubripirellula sp.]